MAKRKNRRNKRTRKPAKSVKQVIKQKPNSPGLFSEVYMG